MSRWERAGGPVVPRLHRPFMMDDVVGGGPVTDCQIVRDQHESHAVLVHEASKKREDFGLGRDVKRGPWVRRR